MQLYLLSLLVSNHFGVLMRVTSVFSRRTFNIKSLTVAETYNPDVSRITILLEGDEEGVGQLRRLLKKQEDVIRIAAYPRGSVLERELLLLKMRGGEKLSKKLEELSGVQARIVREIGSIAVVEYVGDLEGTEQFIAQMEPLGILEVCRTGVAAMSPGASTLYDH